MDNQNAFLNNIRRALSLPPEWQRSAREVPALFAAADTGPILQRLRSRTAAEMEQLSELLQKNAAALGITTHVVRSHEEAARVVVELVTSKQPEFSDTKQIIHHDHPDLAALQLWQHFAREAVTVHTTFGADRQLREKTIASFIGITAPAIGVADSATLVDLTGPGRPRSTSLVPSIHIALLDRKNLVADLAEAYALLREKKPPDSLVFITGPSKTADIEAQMVHGAHGPREVHIIVLSSSPAAAAAVETDNPPGN